MVVSEGKTYNCFALKKIKQKTKLLIGDNVQFFKEDESLYIDKVLPRKNQLIRPKIANIDALNILIAPAPKPDLLLVDKMVLYARLLNIEVNLIINKIDLVDSKFINDINTQYNGVVNTISTVSAVTSKNIGKLMQVLKNKFSVFAGQSAVGKSTLLNAIEPKFELETGGLSKKTNRGKHTTRHTEIFEVEENTFIADTPGFSLLELEGIEPNKLHELYEDFEDLRINCKYRACNHVQMDEKECTVKQAVTEGNYSQNRYNRYVVLYNEIKDKWEKKYG